jgi:hypothetical protein
MTTSTINPGFCAVALGQGLLMGPAAQDDRWHDDGAGWALEEEEAEEVAEFEVAGFGHVLKAA